MQLLSEEYGLMSPKTIETKGLINASEYQKIYSLTQSVSSDVHKKIAGNYTLFFFFCVVYIKTVIIKISNKYL